MENKKTKRFYKVGEMVWVVSKKKEGKVKSINKDTLEVIVEVKVENAVETLSFKMWEIDKLKYKAKEELAVSEKLPTSKSRKTTYFSSVKGGIIPTKDEENAGRDCYARLEPVERNGKVIHELFIPQLTLAKIPLGFASYLDKNDLLSLKHERSSIGSAGLINLSGLIDSTYQGEVILQVVPLISNVLITSEVEDKFYDEETNTHVVPYYKAVAQAVILVQSDATDTHIPYEDLLTKPSTRGVNGWGSTSK